MKRAAASLLLSFVAGCGNAAPPSPDTTELLGIGEIVVTARAESNGAEVLVTASISSTRQGSYVLGESDRLLASATDAPAQELAEFDASAYATLLPTGAGTVTLALDRPSDHVSADIELPPSFTLLVPAGTVSAAAGIPLSWEAADTGDAMSLFVYGPCVSPLSRGFTTDTGSYAIQPGDLAFAASSGCVLTITLTRSRSGGPFDLGANNGSFTSAQVRTAALAVTP